MQESIRMEKKKRILIFGVILLLQCLVIVAWGTQKTRLNIDEMFTMEGVKQSGQSMGYWDKAEDFYGREHTYQEFLEHMTVTTEDLLLHKGIVEVGNALLHKEFYYALLNLVSTVHPGQIPWTVGVGVNLLFFIAAQVLLYLIARKILGEAGALATVVMYGFSTGAISTVLYVRCYMLLTLYVLLSIYLYMQFMDAEKGWQRILYIVSLEFLAFLCYRTHQFGTILFAIITAVFVLYMIGGRKGKCLIWLAAGYGFPALLGIRIILPRLSGFFDGGVAPIFYSSVRNMSGERFAGNVVQMLCIVAQHFFVRVRIMLLIAVVLFLLYGRIVYMRRKNVEGCERGERNHFVMILFVIMVVLYYGILIMGGAIDWKYLSPVYPLIALVFMSMVIPIGRAMNLSFRVKAAVAVFGMLLTFVSYDAQHVSELFAEEAGMRDALEAQYSGVNGIMVHHDVQGDGENCLYEAATLWPEDSNILVLQHHMILEKGLFTCRDDDKILLWLTADFDREETIDLFQVCTNYTDFKLILNTDHVWVYECNK